MMDAYHAMARRKAALDTGFTRELGGEPAGFQPLVAEGTVWLTGKAGVFTLSTDHIAAAEAIGATAGHRDFEGAAALTEALHALHAAMKSLPYDVVAAFDAKTAGLPQVTEAERLVVQRIGQDIFRSRLVQRWGPACPMTGITDPALLRASHIKAWAECTTSAERLDPENGILLSALWDAAFDRGLVGFDDAGKPLFFPGLSLTARTALGTGHLTLTERRRAYLAVHRAKWGLG